MIWAKLHCPPKIFWAGTAMLDSLIQNYNERFKGFEKHENWLKLTFMPHLVDIPSAPANLKMELIELSEDNIMKYVILKMIHSKFGKRD